ncbi:MAG: hypothetical protein IH845_00610 [Nanoarchaeota archaeon]|nr:hypothetical protein [Nanoarchaeota archaeon]
MNKLCLIIIIGIIFFNFIGIASVSALSITVHVPEKYNEVNAGERFYFEISVKYPENPTRIDLRLTYEVVDANGEVIASAKTLKAVETQASFIDFIVLPDEMEFGRHEIDILVRDYGDLDEKVGSSFNVTRNRVDTLFTYVYILIGAVVLLLILIIVVLLRRGR